MPNGVHESDIRYHHAKEVKELTAKLDHSEQVREMVTTRLHTIQKELDAMTQLAIAWQNAYKGCLAELEELRSVPR